MKSIIPLLVFVLATASCGAPPDPTDTADEELDTYKFESLGGTPSVSYGFRVGDPAPIMNFQAGFTPPPMPHNNAEHAFSSFDMSASISSNHADGGRESMEFELYRDNASHSYQFLINTRDGDTFGYPASHIVYPGDGVFAIWQYSAGCIRVHSDNASGLGTAFDECVPFAFTSGGHYPDTVYPLNVEANVVTCAADMPWPNGGAANGAITTWTLYGIGSNGPWTSTGPAAPLTAGCGMAQSYNSGTQLNTILWTASGAI